MTSEGSAKRCFVIAPIGDPETETRRRSDQVLPHIVRPAANQCGYTTTRADEISEPGMIPSQVIQHLVEDELVVADLTGRNPNVFYELAIRHAFRKPVVQIIEEGENIPFDVAQSRTIKVNHHDLDSVERCKSELVAQIQAVERDPSDVDTPLTTAFTLQALRQSENPLEKSSAEIISMLHHLFAMVESLQSSHIRETRSSVPVEWLVRMDESRLRVYQILEVLDDLVDVVTPEQLEYLRHVTQELATIIDIDRGTSVARTHVEPSAQRRRPGTPRR